MKKAMILVVEDDAPIRNLITTTLKTRDYGYLAASTGECAILEASSHNPDIILLDLGLPDMDGIEVIRKIRSWSNTPIIVISARSEDTDKIEALGKHEPTQLYISLDAPNKEIYKKVCKPQVSNGWEKLQESLELLSTIDTRKVLRITSVKDLNMIHTEEYAKIIEKADIDYVEIKAYMFVGDSRNRLQWENMPKTVDIQEFAQSIAEKTSMNIIDEVEKSRVLLLGEKKPGKYNN